MSDLISRPAAIDAIEKAVFKHVAIDAVKNLPSVELKKGKWAREVLGSTSGYGTTVMYQCSQCEKMSISRYHYCPNCGAEMRGDSDE